MFSKGLQLYNGQWERFTETLFINSVSHMTEANSKILDVGFAGGWYLLDLVDKFKCYGLDNDPTRIDGTLFTHGRQQLSDLWNNDVLSKMTHWEDSILNFNTDEKFDLVMSISTIEHIYPTHYQNSDEFVVDADIRAVEAMKSLITDNGSLLLTFPCGLPKRECRSDNPIKDKLKDYGFVAEERNVMYYDMERINAIIGDWIPTIMLYWVNPIHLPISEQSAMNFKNGPSTGCICTMLLNKVSDE